MKNIFIINAHQEFKYSKGKLNQSFVDKLNSMLQSENFNIKTTTMKDEYVVDEEIRKHRWADIIVLQSPVNWMSISWSFKKYMDFVYSGGLDGRLCNGDGRSRNSLEKQYGTGGTLKGKKYMLSLTFNAPKDAFNDKDQWFFEGISVDDLFRPVHLNFRFFGMEPLETFVCYDVVKNPDLENDFIRFEEHVKKQIIEPIALNA